MYANSVLPPFDGIARACSSEYFAGITLNELSECQRRLPMANSRRRSSRANTWLFLSRFDTSANVGGSRYSSGARRLEFTVCSRLPRLRVKASCWSSVSGWSWKTSTAYLSMPAWTAATSSGDKGFVRSRPSISAAKHGPIWRRVTDIVAGIEVLPLAFAEILDSTRPRGHLVQEGPERHQEPGGVVALHGVAGLLDLHPAAVGQRAGQFLGVLVMEHVALGPAHHEGGTFHPGHCRPEQLAAPRVGRWIDPAAVPLVVLPHPLPVGHLSQVVQETPPQQRGVAAGVEGQRAVHEGLDRIERRRFRGECLDLRAAGRARLRADVDEHEPGQAPAVRARPHQRVGATKRHADQDEAIEPHAVDERVQVGGVALGRVVHHRRPLAVAVAALVERQTVPLGL